MCGFVGWFGAPPEDNQSNHQSKKILLEDALNIIRHRGPDGSGIYMDDHAALGHVRLAIIDPKGGQQPLLDYQKRAVIAYNGEAYNFLEYRKKLQQQGFKFQTRSDTETVLALYLEEGWQSLGHLSGMFALALWHPEKKQGLLIRDRQGIKPLFYRQEKQRLLFASEAKAIRPLMAQKSALDETALHLLLNFRYIPGDQTLFKGIQQLPPGGVLIWSEKSIQQYQLPPYPTSDHAFHIDHFRTLILKAVDHHLVSDVPVGAYLSAGLDSATIVAAIKEKDPERLIPTFTIEAGDSPLEADGATETARFFGISNERQPMSENFADQFSKLIWHLEKPKVNAFQSHEVAALAGKHVKVVLSGLGGDEIFLGYTLHRFLWWHEKITHNPLLSTLTKISGQIGASILGSIKTTRLEEYQRGLTMLSQLGNPKAYGILRNLWDDPKQRSRLYGPRLLDHTLPNAFDWLEDHWSHKQDNFFDQAVAFENRHKLVNDFLWQEDRMSMAEGVEVRTPFLDEQLNAVMQSLSWNERMPQGQAKGLMRQLIQPWLNEEILNRPKSGFQVDAAMFFERFLKPMIPEYLSQERLEKDGLFNPLFIQDILKQKPNKKLRWHYFIIYLMLGTTMWLEQFEA
ncbi:asparagine synthase (glutamine-hydrolyzing) [Magnetococcales bacterium HHB-1]